MNLHHYDEKCLRDLVDGELWRIECELIKADDIPNDEVCITLSNGREMCWRKRDSAIESLEDRREQITRIRTELWGVPPRVTTIPQSDGSVVAVLEAEAA